VSVVDQRSSVSPKLIGVFVSMLSRISPLLVLVSFPCLSVLVGVVDVVGDSVPLVGVVYVVGDSVPLVCVVDVVGDSVPQPRVSSDRVVVQLAPQVVLRLLQLHYLVPQLSQLWVQNLLLLCQLHLV